MLTKIKPKATDAVPTAAQIATGIPISPISLIRVLSPSDWEDFTHEWLWYYENTGVYSDVNKFSGAGDLGLDLIAFTDPKGFDAPWDSFQCKRYGNALEPGDVFPEVAKIIFHSFTAVPPFNQQERIPRRHVFVSPLGIGITVNRLMKDAARFKTRVRTDWDKLVPKISSGLNAPLVGELLAWFEGFDFSIFQTVSAVDLIATHKLTGFHAMRFGGGLPPRAPASPPPLAPSTGESVYIRKLFEAYGDILRKPVASPSDAGLALERHYDRQRSLFYSAESLRNFARDRSLKGTFDALQQDIYNGVIDTCEDDHENGFARVKEVVKEAGRLPARGNALYSVSTVADLQGICHQLANEDRLHWIKKS
ncbi:MULTISPECIES: ABC-three component system protein [unclassified Rhizobium]|uniref:ABC-three component system protein n=1 Tax=unclassified Rhizobium TaxID=2613769 RepID=UPI001781CCC3|nr:MULTISPECIES: ABC-three component system protein [unclassified Rhizobium]MBD8687236.1 hypothetical protein [Rhizobium sp. CFBP 13644]MBD8690961.1 hypothetical protein [Rhizobium sp. CFBP 13717]